jgi:hypothetical protein
MQFSGLVFDIVLVKAVCIRCFLLVDLSPAIKKELSLIRGRDHVDWGCFAYAIGDSPVREDMHYSKFLTLLRQV